MAVSVDEGISQELDEYYHRSMSSSNDHNKSKHKYGDPSSNRELSVFDKAIKKAKHVIHRKDSNAKARRAAQKQQQRVGVGGGGSGGASSSTKATMLMSKAVGRQFKQGRGKSST